MDRREFLSWVQGGLAGAAAASLLLRDGSVAGRRAGEASPPCPHFPPKATRALHICLCGAMSHIDTFDYKPGLIAAHGKSLKSSTRPDIFFGQVGRLRRPDWTFRQRGQSGLWVSDLFPHLGAGRRRADGDPVDGRRHLEPHAGDVSGEQRLSLERLSRPGHGFATGWAASRTTCRRLW